MRLARGVCRFGAPSNVDNAKAQRSEKIIFINIGGARQTHKHYFNLIVKGVVRVFNAWILFGNVLLSIGSVACSPPMEHYMFAMEIACLRFCFHVIEFCLCVLWISVWHGQVASSPVIWLTHKAFCRDTAW